MTNSQVTADAAALKAAADHLARRLIERRNTVPILSCLVLSASAAGGLALYGCDLDIGATLELAAEWDGEPFQVAVDAAGLRDAVAKCKGNVTLAHDADAGRIIVKAGRTRFNVPTSAIDNVPYISTPDEWPTAFALPVETAAADFRALSPAISNDGNRYYLCGLRLEIDGGDLCMVATDGHVLAIARRDVPDGAADMAGCTIPAKAIALLVAMLKGTAGELALAIDSAANRIAVTGPGFRMVAKLVDGTFPEWQRLVERFASPDAIADAPLFPDLMAGAPTAQIERIEKAVKLALDWTATGDAMIGRTPTDSGLFYLAMNFANGACARKGFDYHWQGHGEAEAYLISLADARGLPSPAEIAARADAINAEWGEGSIHTANGEAPHERARFDGARLVTRGNRIVGLTIAGEHKRQSWSMPVWTGERPFIPGGTEALEGSYSIVMPADGPVLTAPSYIDGPDGHRYPVADNGTAIHLSKEQVRDLVGESCFETIELSPGYYVCRWIWEQGDSRLLLVGKDGRAPKSADMPRQYIDRADAEAMLAGADDRRAAIHAKADAMIASVRAETPPPVEETAPVSHETAPAPLEAAEEPTALEAPSQGEAPETLPAVASGGEAGNPQLYALFAIVEEMQGQIAALQAAAKPETETRNDVAPIVVPENREKRLRLVRRYLAMRAERAALRAECAKHERWHREYQDMANTALAGEHAAKAEARRNLELVARESEGRVANARRARRMIAAERAKTAAVRDRLAVVAKARETLEFDRDELVETIARLELEAKEPRALYQGEIDRLNARCVWLENREIERLSKGKIRLNMQGVEPAGSINLGDLRMAG